MVEVISKYEMQSDRPRLFSVENDEGSIVKVSMHPNCYLKMSTCGFKAICVPCLRQLDQALSGPLGEG